MRRIVIFFLIFQPAMLIGGEAGQAEIMKKIISRYDEGKAEDAISGLKTLASRPGADAFVCWLNIAVIEAERNQPKAAEDALHKASSLQHSSPSYLHMCRKLLSGENLNLDNQLIYRMEMVSAPSEKFLLWQFLCYSLGKITLPEWDDFKKAVLILQKNLKHSTLRYAKILSAESSLSYMNHDESMRIAKLIASNRMLDSLHYSHSVLYIKNVRKLFYYSLTEENKKYTSYFLKYQRDSHLMQNKEIRLAVNYFKARYFYMNQDLKQSLIFCRKAYAIDPDDQNVITYLAFIYRNLKEYKLAIHYYRRLKGPLFGFDSRIGILRCAFESGDTLLGKKMAGILVKEASLANTELFDLHRIANNLFYTGQFDYFFKLDRQLMEKYIREKPKSIYMGIIFNYTGIYYWQNGDFRKSLGEFQKAILALLPQESRADPLANLDLKKCSSYPMLIDYLNNKGEAFYQLSLLEQDKNQRVKYLHECYKNLNLSIEQMYKYKLQLPFEEQIYLYSGLTRKSYPNMIKVCLELYNQTGEIRFQEKAFQFAEQARAIVMLSMFRGNNAGKIGLLPAPYKALEDSVNLQATVIHQRLQAMKEDHPEMYPLHAKLDMLAAKRAELERMYRNRYPLYYRLRYSTEVTSVPAIQQYLGNDECLVEFLLHRNFLITFYIDKKNFLIKTDSLKNINLTRLTETFYHRMSQFSLEHYQPGEVKAFAADAGALYNLLLRPFENNIQEKKIIVVADNDLQKVAFEVLLTGSPADLSGYRRLPYLLRRNTVFYTPSATFLGELRKRETTGRRAKLLAVAPEYPGKDNTRSGSIRAVRPGTSILESLPYARKEVQFAHAIAGGRLLSGEEASETRFKKMVAGYEIIHLAAHGRINEESMFDSRLVFAGDTLPDDGFLYNYEIYGLKHTSRLVILSACNTGNGKNYEGEGMISTGRSFLSSGSRSVIMTLWKINDLASYELMKGFYIHLKNKFTISEALRQSKLDFLRQTDNLHSHPFFWSAYIGYGDASFSVKIGSGGKAFLWVIPGLFVLFTAFFSASRKLFPYKRSGS